METTVVLPQKVTHFFKKNAFERSAWDLQEHVIGIDEVGRGPSAGPVVAAAVMLYPNAKHALLKDSKILNHEELEKAYHWIIRNSWHGTGVINNRVVDSVNIYKASQIAMKRALAQLKALTPPTPSKILIDAMPLSQQAFQAETLYFIKGETKSTSIAAASIVAKVTRDRIMHQLHRSFPAYNFAQHKGYNTPGHKKALSEHTNSIIHRLSFIPIREITDEQTTIF